MGSFMEVYQNCNKPVRIKDFKICICGKTGEKECLKVGKMACNDCCGVMNDDNILCRLCEKHNNFLKNDPNNRG